MFGFTRKRTQIQLEDPIETAIDLVDSFLSDTTTKYEHTYGVYSNVLKNIRKYCNHITFSEKNHLIQASLLHDLGYSDRLNKVDFHPVDGFNYLKESGFDDTVYKLVLYHSYSDVLCMQTRPSLYHYYIENTLTSKEKELLDILSLSDFTSDVEGTPVSLRERLEGILERHGNSDVYRHAEMVVAYLEHITKEEG